MKNLLSHKLRYLIGRFLVHFGLWIMPPGQVRTELYTAFQAWGIKVHTLAVVERARRAQFK